MRYNTKWENEEDPGVSAAEPNWLMSNPETLQTLRQRAPNMGDASANKLMMQMRINDDFFKGTLL